MRNEINSLQFGEFTLDRHAREVRRQGVVLPVTGKAFDLLSFMAGNPGRALSKSELLEAVWPETSVEESNLSQNVFLLRKVLGSSGDGPIKTLPGRGYQFTAQVSHLATSDSFNAHALPLQASVSSISLEATHSRTIVERDVEEHVVLPWRLLLGTLAVIVVAIGAGIGLYRHFAAETPATRARRQKPQIPGDGPRWLSWVFAMQAAGLRMRGSPRRWPKWSRRR